MTDEGVVWSKLPDDVMENIFGRLGLCDTVRAGCACKTLRAFVFSSTNRRLFSPSSVSLLECSADRNSSTQAYDDSRDAWVEFSLAFLHPYFAKDYYPVASAGGLLCFNSRREYVVCNPITRSCRRLPTLPHHVPTRSEHMAGLPPHLFPGSDRAFGLTYDSMTGNYELYTIYCPALHTGLGSTVSCYSSVLTEWRVLPPPPGEPCRLRTSTITPCSSGLYSLWDRGLSLVVFGFCNGVWTEIERPECTSMLCSEYRANVGGKLCIDVWTEIERPECASILYSAWLANVGGSLHMVSTVYQLGTQEEWVIPGTEQWRERLTCRIWKLDMESKGWKEVVRTDSYVYRNFIARAGSYVVQCWGKDGTVYLKGAPSDILTCSLARNEWKWLKAGVRSYNFIFDGSLSALA